MAERAPIAKIVRPLRSGQVTIPAIFRKQLGITEDSLLQITLAEGELRLRPVRLTDTQAGSAWLEELYRRFTPVREEAQQYSESEIDAVIDVAAHAVRERHA